jgi:hypothetical protein
LLACGDARLIDAAGAPRADGLLARIDALAVPRLSRLGSRATLQGALSGGPD